MKKTTWLLLAISLVAMLLVAGCAPTTPKPTASPTPTPTATPTTPPSNYCPTTVETVVTSLYCGTDPNYAESASAENVKASFSILISFDKDIVLLDDNETNWEVTVDRYVPYKDANNKSKIHEFKDKEAKVIEVKQVGTKLVKITATITDINGFNGLICGQDCYEVFVDLITDASYADTAYADKIAWKYKGGNYPYTDILGNPCPDCTIEGEACCQACEECVPEPGCPIGTICD